MVLDRLEVLEAARKLALDVILLDVGLPGLNGHKVATLREEMLPDKTLPVGITGAETETHDLAAGEAGFGSTFRRPSPSRQRPSWHYQRHADASDSRLNHFSMGTA